MTQQNMMGLLYNWPDLAAAQAQGQGNLMGQQVQQPAQTPQAAQQPAQPPTPPVQPFQGDPYKYGFGGEHLFFGGMNGQPYGLTSFTGYKAPPQITQESLEQMLQRIMAQYQQPSTSGYYLGGGADGGTDGGGSDGGGW